MCVCANINSLGMELPCTSDLQHFDGYYLLRGSGASANNRALQHHLNKTYSIKQLTRCFILHTHTHTHTLTHTHTHTHTHTQTHTQRHTHTHTHTDTHSYTYTHTN